jgi:hypothetical protein
LAKKKSKKVQKRHQQKRNKKQAKKKRTSRKRNVQVKRDQFGKLSPNIDEQNQRDPIQFPRISSLKNFDAANFRIVCQSLAPDEYEKVMIRNLKHLDYQLLYDEKQSSQEQSGYLVLGTQLNFSFRQWCREKGITEDLADIFSFCAGHFFDAMYGTYQRPLPLLYSGVLDMFLAKFLSEEIFEGMSILSYIPKSLQLFYRFLQEKGYGIYYIANIIYDIEEFDRVVIGKYVHELNAK